MAEENYRHFSMKEILTQDLDRELSLGHPDTGGEDAELLMPYSGRSAHLHVIGQTRSGKSRFLADLIQQDIVNRQGLTLIDPHGGLYKLITEWIAENNFMFKRRKNIHPVEFCDPNTTFVYNPLHIDTLDESFGVASNVTNALTSIYGGNDPNATPLTKATLNAVCLILAQRRLPLAGAQYMLLEGHADIRRKIVEGVPNDYYRHLGDQMVRMTPREFRETVASTERRVREFIGNPQVCRIFSKTENTANLQQIMDEGHVLLINSAKNNKLLDFSELRALSMLCINNLFGSSFGREITPPPRPHYLYIDEVQRLLSDDIENIVSQSAKFGLFVTLAHQTLGHLMSAGDNVYRGVMSGTLLKAIFSIPMAEAEVLQNELFASEIDYELVKEKLKTPHAVGVVKDTLRSTTRTTSDGVTVSDTDTDSDSEANTRNLNATTFIPNDPAGTAPGVTQGLGEGHAHQRGRAHSSAYAVNTANSFGETIAETYRPVYEWFSTQTKSLQEQQHDFARRIHAQKPRHFYLAMRGEPTLGMGVRNVPDPIASPRQTQALITRLQTESPWIVPASEIPPIAENPELKKILNEAVASPIPPEPASYFEPDSAPPGQPG